MLGLQGTPYSDKVFKLEIAVPERYTFEFEPPKNEVRHSNLQPTTRQVITCAPGGGDVSNIDSSLAILDAQPPYNTGTCQPLNQKVLHKLADQNCCFYLAAQIFTEFRHSSPQSIWHGAWHML